MPCASRRAGGARPRRCAALEAARGVGRGQQACEAAGRQRRQGAQACAACRCLVPQAALLRPWPCTPPLGHGRSQRLVLGARAPSLSRHATPWRARAVAAGGLALAQPRQVRYRDGAIVTTSGDKYIIEKPPEFDGGSRGKVGRDRVAPAAGRRARGWPALHTQRVVLHSLTACRYATPSAGVHEGQTRQGICVSGLVWVGASVVVACAAARRPPPA